MTIGEVIISYRKEHSLSQREFARRANVSNGYISMLENNANPKTGQPIQPTLPIMKNLASAMGITLHSLMKQANDTIVDVGEPEEKPLPDNILPMPKMRQIPLVGDIACGVPILAVENVEDMVNIPENIRADFALRCKGDSMINARIYDGDIVYIRQQPVVDNGQIAAVLIDDEATLKRFRKYSDHIVLEPANPQFMPLSYWGDDMKDVHVLGLAVAFTSTIVYKE